MNESNYYAILPATVRYDKRLTANAKLLYAEITSLTHKTGYCYATNEHFADLYDVNQNTVREWMSQLEKAGYINREILYKENTKEVSERRIRIFELPPLNFQPTPPLNFEGDNNKDINIKFKNNPYNPQGDKEYTEDFLDFWRLYPKQRAGSKEKAFKAYLKALKEKRTTKEQLHAAVKRYAFSDEVLRGFAKGCAAWLNDDRFNTTYTQERENKWKEF